MWAFQLIDSHRVAFFAEIVVASHASIPRHVGGVSLQRTAATTAQPQLVSTVADPSVVVRVIQQRMAMGTRND